MKSVQKNIGLYYAFKLFCEPTLWGAILIMYITRVSGMKLSEIYFMEACCVIIVMALQVPTGAIADKYGRANSIRIGIVLLLAEMICFSLATNHIWIWVSNSLWAIGFSFISGADSSLLYDSLKSMGRESEFKKIVGRSSAYKLGITAVCALAVGHIAKINIRLPIAIDTVLVFVGLIISLFFKEPPNGHSPKVKYYDHMMGSIKQIFRAPRLLWIVAFSVLIGVTSKLWFFTYNPYFELVKLPLPYYGYVFAVLNLVASASSYNADRISRHLSEKTSVKGMLGLIVVPIWLMGAFVSVWAIPLVFLQNLVRGYINPFLEHMMHEHIDSSNRATVMSVKSACNSAVEIVAMISFSVVTASFALNHALSMLGLVACIVGMVLVCSYTRVFRK